MEIQYEKLPIRQLKPHYYKPIQPYVDSNVAPIPSREEMALTSVIEAPFITKAPIFLGNKVG